MNNTFDKLSFVNSRDSLICSHAIAKWKRKRGKERLTGSDWRDVNRELPMNFYYYRFPDLKRVTWPPPPEEQDFDYVEQAPVQAKVRRWIITIAGTYLRAEESRVPRYAFFLFFVIVLHVITRSYVEWGRKQQSARLIFKFLLPLVHVAYNANSYDWSKDIAKLKKYQREGSMRIAARELRDLRNRDALCRENFSRNFILRWNIL